MAVTAKRELIEDRLCVARDTKVDVYGFVFYRGMFEQSETSALQHVSLTIPPQMENGSTKSWTALSS